MTHEMANIISVFSLIITCLIAIFNLKRIFNKDIVKRAEERSKSNGQLENIAIDIKEIVNDIKLIQKTISKHTKDIAVMRETAKSAHQRIDDLKDEIRGGDKYETKSNK